MQREEQMPEINVSASEGKALQVLARIIEANRILEIGTLGAYSTIWLARGLPPDGKLITLGDQPPICRSRPTQSQARPSGA